MPGETDIPAWIIFLVGIYSIAASIGELRQPGFWLSMIDDLAASPAIRFLVGIVLIALGGAIYLVGPWSLADWMLVVVKAVGAWMVIEGALFLALGDKFIGMGKAMMGAATKVWVSVSLLLGLAFVILAAMRLI